MMVNERISKLLKSLETSSPHFPPTIFYNEGWMLRLLLDWFSTNSIPNHPFTMSKGDHWYSEALLPSAFLARHKGDKLAESRTHADGAIGHIQIGQEGRADLGLLPNAEHFIVIEAKMFSSLSSGVTNARYYDQAARNVACIAETLRRGDRRPEEFRRLGFYLVAPRTQLDKGDFKEVSRGSIQEKVARRVSAYAGEKDQWHSDWFLPTIEVMEIGKISWEETMRTVRVIDKVFAHSMKEFYGKCLEFNR